MPETTISTTLTESVNIVLANIGESPVNSITGAIPVQVSLALNTIEEVSADVQSKGWWFNQNSSYDVNGVATGTYAVTNDITIRPSDVSNDWHDGIPEEARRYITIRSSRIAQTRLVGSEELQKFSYNEELVSLAILQQAHVRNSNGVLDFNEFPAELKGLGVDEVMFLQGNVEEKIGTLRLGGELANIAKTKAETSLIADQEALVTQQTLTEAQETSKRTSEKALIDAQELKTDAEKLLVDKQTLDVAADTTLKGKQGALVDAQELKTDAEAALITSQTTTDASQRALVDAQELKTDAEKLQVDAQTSLLESQKTQLDAQTAIEATAEKAFYDGVVAGTQDTYRDYAAEMRMMGIQESTFQQTPAYKKVELLKDTVKLRESHNLLTDIKTFTISGLSEGNGTYTQTSTTSTLGTPVWTSVANGETTTFGTDGGGGYYFWQIADVSDGNPVQQSTAVSTIEELKAQNFWEISYTEVGAGSGTPVFSGIEYAVPEALSNTNKVLRLVGEPPVSSLNSNALANECLRLLMDTDKELQGRGWWFNTETEVEFTAHTTHGHIVIPDDVLSVEVDGYDTRLKVDDVGDTHLYNLKEKSTTSWSGTIKAKVIYRRDLNDVPEKYLEYLQVRTAILLTEMYPQSGIDIQRLPKMEQELRAYFKDREFDDANYSVFDNYDAASRMGVNRNYSIL